MNYVNKDDEAKKNDELVEDFGVKVYVDPKAIFFIVGTEMDYVVSAFLLQLGVCLYGCMLEQSTYSQPVSFLISDFFIFLQGN